MEATMVQQWKCKNDVNGNPRRLWVFLGVDGLICGVLDEGYGGKPTCALALVELPSMEITPAKYREIKRKVGESGLVVTKPIAERIDQLFASGVLDSLALDNGDDADKARKLVTWAVTTAGFVDRASCLSQRRVIGAENGDK